MALSLASFSELHPSASADTVDVNGQANILFRTGSTPTEVIIQAMTVTFESKNGVNVRNAFLQADKATFNILGKWYTVDVTQVQVKSGYLYIDFPDIVIDELPTTLHDPFGSGPVPWFEDSQFVFNPYVELKFLNDDYNPLLSNAINTRTSLFRQEVDRRGNQAIPTNYVAILSQSATKAEVQDSDYTTTGWVNARYRGTSLNSGSVPGDNPAQYLRGFEVSIHPSGSDTATIKATAKGDREIETIFFNPENIQNNAFPIVGKILYEAQGNRFIRMVNKSVYSIDDGKVYTTGVLGIVSNIT